MVLESIFSNFFSCWIWFLCINHSFIFHILSIYSVISFNFITSYGTRVSKVNLNILWLFFFIIIVIILVVDEILIMHFSEIYVYAYFHLCLIFCYSFNYVSLFIATTHQQLGTIFYACRAYSSSLLLVIIAVKHLPVFKIFSNFEHFFPNFQMFCTFLLFFTFFLLLFLPFFGKIPCIPLLSRIGPDMVHFFIGCYIPYKMT